MGAAFLELPMLLLLYRKWTWWAYALGATVFGAFNAAVYGASYQIVQTPAEYALGIALSLGSCYLTLACAMLLRRSLERAGIGVLK